MSQRLTITAETWPIAGRFVISRGAKTEAHVVVVHVTDGNHAGRGEAVPYARYGESLDQTLATLRGLPCDIDRGTLQTLLPAGAARNALDCALWDLEAKRSGVRSSPRCRARYGGTARHVLHAEPRYARGDGGARA